MISFSIFVEFGKAESGLYSFGIFLFGKS